MFGKELAALMAMKAMTDPGEDIEDQVNKTLSKKIRVADRSRPHVIQLWTAFQRTVQWRRSKGEKNHCQWSWHRSSKTTTCRCLRSSVSRPMSVTRC